MLVFIRQPLGAAALLSLLSSGLWSAEVLAYARFRAQLTGQIAWDAAAFDDRDLRSDRLASGHHQQPSWTVSKSTDSRVLNSLARHLVQFIATDCGHCQSFSDLTVWRDVAKSSCCFLAPQAEPDTLIAARFWAVTLPDLAALYGAGAEHG